MKNRFLPARNGRQRALSALFRAKTIVIIFRKIGLGAPAGRAAAPGVRYGASARRRPDKHRPATKSLSKCRAN